MTGLSIKGTVMQYNGAHILVQTELANTEIEALGSRFSIDALLLLGVVWKRLPFSKVHFALSDDYEKMNTIS